MKTRLRSEAEFLETIEYYKQQSEGLDFEFAFELVYC